EGGAGRGGPRRRVGADGAGVVVAGGANGLDLAVPGVPVGVGEAVDGRPDQVLEAGAALLQLLAQLGVVGLRQRHVEPAVGADLDAGVGDGADLPVGHERLAGAV